MRYKKFLSVVVIAVFLFGVLTTSKVDAVEGQRGILRDHEQRITALETNDAAQDTELADHETRISDLEQQTPSPGIKVKDNSGNVLGILLGYDAEQRPFRIQIFVPSLQKTLIVSHETGEIGPRINFGIVYTEPNCEGDAYIQEDLVSDFIFKGYNDQFYTADTTEPLLIIYQSRSSTSTGSCAPADCSDAPLCQLYSYPVNPVPPGTLPFTGNVDIPLHYEY
jgi:hypothetical protein